MLLYWWAWPGIPRLLKVLSLQNLKNEVGMIVNFCADEHHSFL